ncbi:MAG: phosphopantetheine-binding protein [Desulfobaccales bacterium]
MAVVIKNVKEMLPDLEKVGVDLNKTYRELDINSLDLVEIVTGTMRELKVKVPINELTTVKTTNDLVDKLFKAASAMA